MHLVTAGFLGLAAGVFAGRLATRYASAIAAGQPPNAATLLHAFAPAAKPPRSARPATIIGATVLCIAFTAAWLAHGWSAQWAALSAMSFLLCCLALIDWRTGLLPDALNLPLLLLGLAAAWAAGPDAAAAALAGAAAGYAIPWLIARGYQAWRHCEGMGRGDLKLAAALGACCGWAQLPSILLLASLGGVIFAIIHQRSLRPGGSYAFGPFLAGAGMIALFGPAPLFSLQ